LEHNPLKKLLVGAAAAAMAACFLFAAEAQSLRKAPELAFTVPGQGDQLLSQYRGKVVALEFILTTCPHCQAASRLMSNFQREFGHRGFQALDVAINGLDEGRTPQQAGELVRNFYNQFQVAFPVGFTPRDAMTTFMGFSLADRFVVPQLVLIDRKGIIHYQTPPLGDEHSMDEAVIRQRIEELLSLSNSASAHTSGKSRVAVAKKSS
jgi:thiol-disulfide isomerase/thioredoxin